jgi:hypothetical protein
MIIWEDRKNVGGGGGNKTRAEPKISLFCHLVPPPSPLLSLSLDAEKEAGRREEKRRKGSKGKKEERLV